MTQEDRQMAPGSLEGLRILDMSRILAGPTATQLMADLGAEVIKVEKPDVGDDTRSWGPPFLPDTEGNDSDLSAYFLCANRNKKSIAIDITSEEGVALLHRLVAISDVVVENYKPGDLTRRGVGYKDLRLIKPDIIWCSISGFGQTGPYSERIGYDILIQAMGGIMSITGEPDAARGQPVKVGVGIADVMCGMYATVGVLAALRHRDRTGEGQYIDLALYDSQVAWLINAATNHLVSGRVPRRLGNAHPNIAPYQTFAAADEHLAVAVGNDQQFSRFAEAIGQPARDRRTASDTAWTAVSCPISRCPSSSSIRRSLPVSPSSRRPVGMPVHEATTSAMSSAVTSSCTISSAPPSAPPGPVPEPVEGSAAWAAARASSMAGISP